MAELNGHIVRDAHLERLEPGRPVVGLYLREDDWVAELCTFARWDEDCQSNIWLDSQGKEQGKEIVIPYWFPLVLPQTIGEEKVEPCGRYLVFVHGRYGAVGGLYDALAILDSLEKAIAYAQTQVEHDSVYVFDRLAGVIVWDHYAPPPKMGPVCVVDGVTKAADV